MFAGGGSRCYRSPMKYNLEDRPGPLPLILYGLQWWIVSLPSVIIMGAILIQANFPGSPAAGAEQIFYMQKLFIIMGLGMLAQTLWGHRLPLIPGPSSVLLIGILMTMPAGPAAVYTALALSGLLLALLGYSGLLGRIHGFFTPRIVAVILLLIAFTLTPSILRMIFSGSGRAMFELGFTLFFVLALLLLNHVLPGIWKSTTLIWGIILGNLAYTALQGAPLLPPAPPGGAFGFGYGAVTAIVPGLEFDPGTLLTFLFCALGLLINELGSIESIGQMLKADDMNGRIRRGVGLAGLSNIVSGLGGVIGPVDFSMSSGVISATGCAARRTLLPAGLMFAACAFFPQFIAALVNLPHLLMGALLLYLMASQMGSGLLLIVKEKALSDFNGAIIVAMPLMVAILVSFAPARALAEIPPLLRSILGNGFIMGVLTVIFLEHVAFRKST